MAISQSRLDELWEFSDPAGSESRLRAASTAEGDPEARAELETQVARALGLQERYEEADALLDGIDAASPAVAARIALERGRLRNSGGDADAAVPLFMAAADLAEGSHPFLQVDALHMLGIADAGHSHEWTARALAVLDGVTDPRTLRWRVSLHNNAGWALVDAGEVADAIREFEHAKDAATRWGTPQQVVWADEALDEARALL